MFTTVSRYTHGRPFRINNKISSSFKGFRKLCFKFLILGLGTWFGWGAKEEGPNIFGFWPCLMFFFRVFSTFGYGGAAGNVSSRKPLQEAISSSKDAIASMNDEIPKDSLIVSDSNDSRHPLSAPISYKNMVTREFSRILDSNEEEEIDMQVIAENTHDIRVEENSIGGYECPKFILSELEERQITKPW